ncbi:hypothetical protein [Mariniblastus fucicola]|uniref:Prepilin-type N-terminal cleavage/methylation domain-containing protein n=1 Tax=Mariniblastus fucicola TaxID=980251 RepID=A0A5B9P5R6_9BACT|nr:hypothetical protein [Mariniblastus fucicola]QEG20515.1 hypothetical protein MFFC18_03640 [Mariniblastus fucicola]
MNISFAGRRSRGYLMLELIIVMSLTVVILSTSSVWVYKSMRYASEVRLRDSHARNISRISRQLRSDAWRATAITVETKTLSITTADEQTIEYLIDENLVSRKRTGGDKTHHDQFHFAPNAGLKWNRDATGSIAFEVSRDFSNLSASKKRDPSGKLDVQIQIRMPVEGSK